MLPDKTQNWLHGSYLHKGCVLASRVNYLSIVLGLARQNGHSANFRGLKRHFFKDELPVLAHSMIKMSHLCHKTGLHRPMIRKLRSSDLRDSTLFPIKPYLHNSGEILQAKKGPCLLSIM